MKIEAKNLEISFGNEKILKSVSMLMPEKKSIGIIGPNGSGKSTFLKCIYRVLKPDKGVVYIDEVALNNLSVRESSKKMSVVAQHNEQSFDFSVMEMVLMGRSPHKRFLDRDTKEDFEIAKDAIEKVGMSDFIKRSYNSLSGGEKQRIILARALAQKTECLILDEPTNHLDIRYQLQFMEIAKQLGVTVISAVHDLNIASMYCEYIFALKNGKIFGHGTPKEFITEEMIKELYGVKAKIINVDDKIWVRYTGLVDE